MMKWVYALPAWVLMPAAIFVACVLSSAALHFTRKRLTRNETITHNDVAGSILGMLGTVLAVLMSFMVVGVWQEYNASSQTALTEASALSDLHHIADALPEPVRHEIKSEIDRYVRLVIDEEWPAMKHGGESVRAHYLGYDIQKLIVNFEPHSQKESLAQAEALRFASEFLDARRQRLRDNDTGIPNVLWSALLFVAVVTILFSFYFKVQQPVAQHIMVMALTAVVTLMVCVIAELDYPFRGDIAIAPDAYTHVYKALHNILQT